MKQYHEIRITPTRWGYDYELFVPARGPGGWGPETLKRIRDGWRPTRDWAIEAGKRKACRDIAKQQKRRDKQERKRRSQEAKRVQQEIVLFNPQEECHDNR
jgi:hypothetical protein